MFVLIGSVNEIYEGQLIYFSFPWTTLLVRAYITIEMWKSTRTELPITTYQTKTHIVHVTTITQFTSRMTTHSIITEITYPYTVVFFGIISVKQPPK